MARASILYVHKYQVKNIDYGENILSFCTLELTRIVEKLAT